MTDKMIPTSGYVAWFCGADDYDVWALPVVGHIPHYFLLSDVPGDVPELEYHPCVLDYWGRVAPLDDMEDWYSGQLMGGYPIGVTPASMSTDQALEHLARFEVPLNPHAATEAEQDERGTPIMRAQRQARGQYVWGRPFQTT